MKLWDREGRLIRALHIDKTKFYLGASFSPSADFIAAAGANAGIDIFTREGYLVATLRGHRHQVNSVVFHPKRDDRVLTAAADNTARIWDPFSDTFPVPARGWPSDIRRARDGSSQMIVSYWEGVVLILNAEGKVLSEVFIPDGEGVDRADLHGDHVVTWGDRYHLWRRTTPSKWEKEWSKDCPNNALSCRFSSDGKRVIALGRDGVPTVYGLDGETVLTIPKQPGNLSTLEFSPGDEYIVTVSATDPEWKARIWTAEGILHKELEHESGVQHATFSPNGDRVLTACHNGNAYLWNLDGQMIRTLKGHEGAVMVGTFSPNGELIATAAKDETARLWNLQGECLLVYPDAAQDVVFTWDSERLLSRSLEWTVKSLIVSPDELLDVAEERAIRQLTTEERERLDLPNL